MAIYIPDKIRNILKYPLNGPYADILKVNPDKIYRNIILAERLNPQFPRADVTGGLSAYTNENVRKSQREGKDRLTRHNPVFDNTGYEFEAAGQRENRDGLIAKEYISIIDIDRVPYEEIRLPFVPRELQYTPQSNFVGIASFGRNNPYYQFTGSEDTLTFEIDWYSMTGNYEMILGQCKRLEALTKADGYKSRPHRCIINWGNTADNPMGDASTGADKLFGLNSKWILVSAPYKMTEFNRGFMRDGEFQSTHMLPRQIVQQVTFKRISDNNRTREDIIGNHINDAVTYAIAEQEHQQE